MPQIGCFPGSRAVSRRSPVRSGPPVGFTTSEVRELVGAGARARRGRLRRPADAQAMGTLNGALKLGQLKIDEFVDADGPSALLDVVAETTCKPKLSWLDVEVLVGSLDDRSFVAGYRRGGHEVCERAAIVSQLGSLTEGGRRAGAADSRSRDRYLPGRRGSGTDA